MLDSILSYFISDPLKILYLIGGGGGLWYWINQWRERIRLNVVIKNEIFDLIDEPNVRVTAEYEIENIGSNISSLSCG